ncbi:MAG: TetR/AcrR family transcriptional regulator [Gammaproteobacteria bacterium]|nr:TetR/AcrR family transcriptional regulator [Gammaproteobacteria bacterium]
MSTVNVFSEHPIAGEKSGDGAAAIRDAAIQLFADRGFEAVPLSAIALQAGVCKANIFYHFGSKELLYVAVVRHACDHMSRLLDDVTSTGSFVDRVRHFACGHMRNLMRYPTLSRLMLREFLDGDARRSRTHVEEFIGANFAKLVDIFRAGQKEGVVRENLDPAALAVSLVAGNVFFFQVRSLLLHFPDARSVDDPEVYSRAVVDVFLNGVLTEQQSKIPGGMDHACGS